MIELKKYWIYLVIILIVLSLYFQLSGTTLRLVKTTFEGLGEPTSTSTTDLFDDNQHLYNSLKSYNTAYYNYVKCVENTYSPSTTTPSYDSSYNNSNGSITFSSTKCATEAHDLNTAYTDSIANISKVKTTSIDIQGGLSSIDEIKQKQNNNQILRSELDMKLQDLYSIQDSLPVMNQTNVDSTTFAFLLWTILASSMLVYVFTGSSSNTTS